MDPFLEKSLSDNKGRPSSTRLIAYKLATRFFPIFNYGYMGIMLLLALLMARENPSTMGNLINFFLATATFVFTLNSTLLAYIFLSKKSGKASETTEIVEMAKILRSEITPEKSPQD